jgi:hypothetical protein
MADDLIREEVKNAIVIEVFNTVRKCPRWHGRWITADDWCELLKRSSPPLASIDTKKLNRAIGTSNLLKYGFEVWESNPIGLMRRQHKMGGKKSTWCYFASVPGFDVPDPHDGTPWFLEVEAIVWPRDTRSTRVEIGQVDHTAPVTDDAGNAKRRRPAVALSLQSVSKKIHEETAWDSGEARRLFASREDDASEDVLEVIKKRLTLLTAAQFNATGYKSVVEEHDPSDLMSTHDIFVVRLKAQYLYIALEEWMPGSVTWTDCCEKAIAHMARS